MITTSEPCMCGDPYCPNCFPGRVDLYEPQSFDELLQCLRENMPHKAWDAYWEDAFIQSLAPNGKCAVEWLDSIFDRVRDDDLLELGKQVHEVRQAVRRQFVKSIDLAEYGLEYEDIE